MSAAQKTKKKVMSDARRRAATEITRALEAIGWVRVDSIPSYEGTPPSTVQDWALRQKIAGFLIPTITNNRVQMVWWVERAGAERYSRENRERNLAIASRARPELKALMKGEAVRPPPAEEADPEILALRRQLHEVKGMLGSLMKDLGVKEGAQ